MAVIRRASDWPRRPVELPRVPHLDRVLLGDPAEFDVREAHNPHMLAPDGGLQAVDRERARRQWEALAVRYQELGVPVAVLPAEPGLPDLCFTANPSMVLPLPQGGGEVWLGRMAHASRQPEVEAHRRFFEGLREAGERALVLREMPAAVRSFEGCGDGLLHPGRFLLHAGVGPRSRPEAWEHLAAVHPDLDVLLYELRDPRFYHLDTALCLLDEATALYVPEAFTDEGRELLAAAFPRLLPVPLEEGLHFAANAFSPDGRHVLIEAGNPRSCALLEDQGFVPVEVDLEEFRKSGGSVFCLKQTY